MLLPCLYKASKTRQNDLMESAGIGKEKRQKRYCGNLSTERGKRNCSPKNQKGQTTKRQQHFFYLPKEFSMTKWQTISCSRKIAEDLNSSCLRGLNWLSVHVLRFFFSYTWISIYGKPKGCLSLGHFNHNYCYYTSLIRRCSVREHPGV